MFLILGNIVPNYGKQFVYFPSVEPWLINADIQARGNLSPYEARDFAVDAENKLITVKGVDDLFMNVTGGGGSGDGVGRGYIVLQDPKELDITGFEVLALLREAVTDISGYKLNIREVQEGPGQFSAPVEIQLFSDDLNLSLIHI